MSSRLEWVRWEMATSGSAEGWGSSSSVVCMMGRSSSMSSGSGRMANGPEKETAMEVRVRDWCVRCVVRASWAVFSLGVVSDDWTWLRIGTYLVAPFSIAIWLPRSRSCCVTLFTTSSDALPFSSMPLRARLSIAAIRASSAGEMPSFSRSESSP